MSRQKEVGEREFLFQVLRASIFYVLSNQIDHHLSYLEPRLHFFVKQLVEDENETLLVLVELRLEKSWTGERKGRLENEGE